MSAIEYLCSAVSGVICTVSVQNFSSDNNRVDVSIDMDLAQSEKFPNLEQMRRIIKEFVPFYCNVSLIFYYSFRDTVGLVFREYHEDRYVLKDEDGSILLFSEVLEDYVSATKEENMGLLNDSYKENSNFLNDPLLLLTNNIFLNSLNGYDTITINGEVVDILTYNF